MPTTTQEQLKLRPYQEKYIEDEAQYRAVSAPRKSGKDFTVCCDIAIHERKALVILPFWGPKTNVDVFNKYSKSLGIQSLIELISAKRITEQPAITKDYDFIYYMEPSHAPLQAHNVLFPRWYMGKRVSYIGTPDRNRNSAFFEFILRANPGVHYWDPTDVFKPDEMSYMMNVVAPHVYRNEILGLP